MPDCETVLVFNKNHTANRRKLIFVNKFKRATHKRLKIFLKQKCERAVLDGKNNPVFAPERAIAVSESISKPRTFSIPPLIAMFSQKTNGKKQFCQILGKKEKLAKLLTRSPFSL